MKLITTTEVCDMLGISKTTLYRWNHLAQDSDDFSIKERLDSLMPKPMKSTKSVAFNFQRSVSDDPAPDNFPRPFKIGRAYKWDFDEIMEWLSTARVKG